MLFCAGSARVAAFKFLKEINIIIWEPLHNNLVDLENIYVENLGTLREPLQYNLGNLDNLYLGILREPLQCSLGKLEETLTI